MSGLVSSLGVLFPEELVRSHPFAILAAFVAINTVIYVVLTVAKAMPKVYFGDYLPRQYARAETRSIYPDGPR